MNLLNLLSSWSNQNCQFFSKNFCLSLASVSLDLSVPEMSSNIDTSTEECLIQSLVSPLCLKTPSYFTVSVCAWLIIYIYTVKTFFYQACVFMIDKRIINRKIQYQKQSTLLAKLPTNSDESQIKILKYGIKTKDGLNYLVQNTARQFFSSRKW